MQQTIALSKSDREAASLGFSSELVLLIAAATAISAVDLPALIRGLTAAVPLTTEEVTAALEELLVEKLVVINDRFEVHVSEKGAAWIEQHTARFTQLFWPPLDVLDACQFMLMDKLEHQTFQSRSHPANDGANTPT